MERVKRDELVCKWVGPDTWMRKWIGVGKGCENGMFSEVSHCSSSYLAIS